jgi:hypothetical protein
VEWKVAFVISLSCSGMDTVASSLAVTSTVATPIRWRLDVLVAIGITRMDRGGLALTLDNIMNKNRLSCSRLDPNTRAHESMKFEASRKVRKKSL